MSTPRSGLESELAEAICGAWAADRIAYLSCSAGTLARDLDRSSRRVIGVDRLVPFDFFRSRTTSMPCTADAPIRVSGSRRGDVHVALTVAYVAPCQCAPGTQRSVGEGRCVLHGLAPALSSRHSHSTR
jgi:hypothetical protein